MRNGKIFYITMIPIIVSVVIGVLLLVFHNSIGTSSKAALMVAGEKNDMNSQISELNSQIDDLNVEIAGYNQIINANSTLINEVTSLNSELDSYNADLENARQRNSELNSQLTEKQEYLDNLSSIGTDSAEGEARELKDGEYKCPADLKSGRYRAEGEGTIYVYNIANSLTVRENLSTIDSHSYEFEISSGEKIKIEGEVSITPLS